MAAALAVMAGAGWVRYGSPLADGYTSGETLNGCFWDGFRGLILSPGKSVFFDSPPLLLALVGLPAAARRWPRLTAFSVGTALAHIALYSVWYGWDGGWCWGPRFLVPIVPLLMPLALPVIDRARRRLGGRMALGLVAVVSLAVQLSGHSGGLRRVQQRPHQPKHPHRSLLQLGGSNPILGQLAALNSLPAAGSHALLSAGCGALPGRTIVRWAPLVVGLVCLAGTAFCLVALLRHRGDTAVALVLIALPIAGLCLSLVLYGGDPWYVDEVGLGPALQALAPRLQPGDAVAVEVLPYLHFYGQAALVLNANRLRSPMLTLLRHEPEVGEVEQGLLSANLGQYRRMWLLLRRHASWPSGIHY